MTLRDFPLLTGENVHPDIVAFLRAEDFDVLDVREQNLTGTDDLHLIRLAHRQSRIILTHDSDFGQLVLTTDESFTGIVYLRPGHIDAGFTIRTLAVVLEADLPPAPFIIVGERSVQRVRMRMRHVGFDDGATPA